VVAGDGDSLGGSHLADCTSGSWCRCDRSGDGSRCRGRCSSRNCGPGGRRVGVDANDSLNRSSGLDGAARGNRRSS
jgi:hypothetical protein